MSPHAHRRRTWLATLTLCALGAALITPVAAPSAGAAEQPEAAYAAFDTLPVQRSGLSATAKVTPLDVSSTEYRYTRGVMQTVSDAASGVVALHSLDADGSLESSVDLSGVLDDIAGAVVFNNWNAKSVLTAVVWGTKNGAPVLARAVSTERRTLAGAPVSVVATDLVHPAQLEALAEAGSGLMAVHRESDGSYVAQRLNYALDAAIGAEIVLDLPAASERRFALDSSYGNIISSRQGAVDVISRYTPEAVYTVDVPDLGLAASLDIADSRLAVADADGDVAVFALEFSAAHSLLTTAHVDGGVRQLSLSSALDEVLVVPTGGGSIERLSAKAGGGMLDAIELAGAKVVAGSLESSGLAAGGVFLADVGGAVYRYSTTLNRAAAVFVYEGDQIARISSVADRTSAPQWSFAALGSGEMQGDWEYSLDGGAHWATRGAPWDSAVPDAGNVRKEPAALPSPLDGVAPATRTEVSVETLHNTSTFARTENAVGIPAVGFDGLWRVRVSNALASVASIPQRITVTNDTPSGAPALTRHPASATVAQSESVILSAEATGTPAPTVQWQVSRDKGATWAPLANQTSPTLALTGRVHEDGSLYRAAFTNSAGTTTSEAARVTVTGPAAQPLGAAPAGAVTATGGSLAYDLSTYSHDWLRATWGEHVSLASPQGFTFGEGSGWVDTASRAAQIQWKGAAVYKPYGGMNGLHITIADPYLAIGADGRGSLTAAVAWNNGGGMGGTGSTSESAGFRRVVIATFATSSFTVDGGTASFSGTPEWQGRTYVKPGLGDATTYPSSYPSSFLDWLDDALRPWFYASGSGLDSKKAPSVVNATFAVTTDPARTDGEAIDPVEPIDVAPTVVQRPLSVTVTAGSTATLTAQGAGRPAPSVRWQRETADGWADVAGATESTLVVEDTTEGVSRYRAVFTNRAGEVASAAARVTVEAKAEPTPEPTVSPTQEPTATPAPTATPEPTATPTPEPTVTPTPEPTITPTPEPTQNAVAPVITSQPVSISAPLSPASGAAEVSFEVAVSGTPVPAVVWQKWSGAGWAEVGEGTRLTYPYSPADAGARFRAVATSPAGTATSSSATLTLGDPAAATTTIATADVVQGDALTLAASVTGTDVRVAWQVLLPGTSTWTDVDGADATTLVVDGADVRHGAQYRVTAHGPIPARIGEPGSEATSEATTVSLSAPPAVPDPATDAALDAAPALTSTGVGRTVTIDVGASRVGRYVDAWVHSTPRHLGWQRVGTDGRITVTVPADLEAGTHRIAVRDADGAVIGVVAVTVSAGATVTVASDSAVTALPATGADAPLGLMGVGVFALLAGFVAVAVVRRRGRARG